MKTKNNEDILIPLSLATGAFNEQEAILLVGYSGGSVIQYKKKTYMTLRSALDWNRAEASMSGGAEKEYRELLVIALESALESGVFQYSDLLVTKWASVFPHYAKKLIDSRSKKADPALKEVVRNAMRT